jgi:hypothetical protein
LIRNRWQRSADFTSGNSTLPYKLSPPHLHSKSHVCDLKTAFL